jgi:aspartate kinase
VKPRPHHHAWPRRQRLYRRPTGEALHATRVDIWTDVPGIYTTDPRVVPAAQRIDVIAFEEAAEMATFGAKVLHPATLLPAVRSDIPVFVGSSKDPKAGGTLVCKKPRIHRCSARWRCAVSRRC